MSTAPKPGPDAANLPETEPLPMTALALDFAALPTNGHTVRDDIDQLHANFLDLAQRTAWLAAVLDRGDYAAARARPRRRRARLAGGRGLHVAFHEAPPRCAGTGLARPPVRPATALPCRPRGEEGRVRDLLPTDLSFVLYGVVAVCGIALLALWMTSNRSRRNAGSHRRLYPAPVAAQAVLRPPDSAVPHQRRRRTPAPRWRSFAKTRAAAPDPLSFCPPCSGVRHAPALSILTIRLLAGHLTAPKGVDLLVRADKACRVIGPMAAERR